MVYNLLIYFYSLHHGRRKGGNMLYKMITAEDMKNDLVRMGRDYYPLEALEAYVQFCEDCGDNIEWDPIAFCCEWEYADASDIISLYSDHMMEYLTSHGMIDVSEDGTLSDAIELYDIRDYLDYYTLNIEFKEGCFLYVAF